jgi:hypothetical protein
VQADPLLEVPHVALAGQPQDRHDGGERKRQDRQRERRDDDVEQPLRYILSSRYLPVSM